MARYYFDIREDDEFIRDDEGGEYSSIEVACDEAVRSLADMAREAVKAGHKNPSDHQMSIEVLDENGRVREMKFTYQVNRRRLDA